MCNSAPALPAENASRDDLRARRARVRAACATAEPRVTYAELADVMSEIDEGKTGSYNHVYLGHVLTGREDHEPHVPAYLGLVERALATLQERNPDRFPLTK